MEKSLKSSFDWIVGFAGFLLPIAASAEFSFEGTGSYANADTTFTEQELYNGSISWFLAPVSEKRGPLAEAAFLSRSSSLRYSFSRAESLAIPQRFGIVPVDPPRPADPEILPIRSPTPLPIESRAVLVGPGAPETNTHSLSARYVIPDTPWVVGSSLSFTNGSFSIGDFFSDQDEWSGALSLGRYVLTNTALSVRAAYNSSEMSADSTLTLNFPFLGINQIAELSSELETETVDIALIAVHVGTVGNYSYQLTANVGYLATETDLEMETLITDADTGEVVPISGDASSRLSLSTLDGWGAGLSGTWYITDRIGLNANYQFSSLESQRTNAYSAGLSWFVTRRFEIRGSYLRNDIDGVFNDIDQWGLMLRGRI